VSANRSSPLHAFWDRVDFPYYIVTVRADDGEMSGCLASFVTQCSIDPPHFLACVAKVNHTFGVAQRCHAMGLHLLGDDQDDLARLFGEQTGDVVDKFAHCEWRVGDTGAPLLVESAASLEGRVLDHFPVGDHEAFLLLIERSEPGEHPGLLTYRDAPRFHPGHPL
jgi:flavin reductase (DIM6/NTAB) family NADH-FMN oxidoreductase RutF